MYSKNKGEKWVRIKNTLSLVLLTTLLFFTVEVIKNYSLFRDMKTAQCINFIDNSNEFPQDTSKDIYI